MMNKRSAELKAILGEGFHACGSRELGTDDEKSDYDFVTTASDKVIEHLEGLGFERMGDWRAYEGEYVLAVYEKSIDGDIVQVSVEVDARYKIAITEQLKKCTALRKLDRQLRDDQDKHARDSLWRSLYKLVMIDSGKTCESCEAKLDDEFEKAMKQDQTDIAF